MRDTVTIGHIGAVYYNFLHRGMNQDRNRYFVKLSTVIIIVIIVVARNENILIALYPLAQYK